MNSITETETSVPERQKTNGIQERGIKMAKKTLETMGEQVFEITGEYERFETGISENYLPNWGVIEGLREFIQNAVFAKVALDNELTLENLDNVSMIMNTPSGITKGKLLVGESEQRDIAGSPGYFGEGFKVGMLVLLRNDRKIKFQTNGFTVIPALEESSLDPDVRTLVFYIYDTCLEEGTRVFVESSAEELEEAKDYFILLKGLSQEVAQSDSIIPSLPGMISVNGVKIVDENSILGYNLTNPKLINRDRSAVDKNLLGDEVRNLLADIDDIKTAETVLTKISEDGNFLESQVGIDRWEADEELWKQASKNVFGNKCALGTGGKSDSTARYKGFKILVSIPSAWHYFFELVLDIPSTSEIGSLAEKNNLTHTRPRGDDAQNLGWCKRMITLYYGDYGTVKIAEDLYDEFGNECYGLYDPKEDVIWLEKGILKSKEETFKTLLHETIHKLTRTEDNTAAFTRAWEHATWMILTRGRGE